MKTISILAVCATLAIPSAALAHGTVRGAERGAAAGGCSSTTVHRENDAGDSTTTRQTDC